MTNFITRALCYLKQSESSTAYLIPKSQPQNLLHLYSPCVIHSRHSSRVSLVTPYVSRWCLEQRCRLDCAPLFKGPGGRDIDMDHLWYQRKILEVISLHQQQKLLCWLATVISSVAEHLTELAIFPLHGPELKTSLRSLVCLRWGSSRNASRWYEAVFVMRWSRSKQLVHRKPWYSRLWHHYMRSKDCSSSEALHGHQRVILRLKYEANGYCPVHPCACSNGSLVTVAYIIVTSWPRYDNTANLNGA